MPNFLKAAIHLTLCLVSGQYADSGLADVTGNIYGPSAVNPVTPLADQTADYKEEIPALGEMANPLIVANGADLIDAISRGSAALQESLIDLAARDTLGVKSDKSSAEQYKFIDTERVHIFMWTGILLTITTYMGVMAFFNMPLKKDPLLYTKLYSTGTH